MKVTAIAPSNLAFVKYWGARDLERAIPRHASLSMTLSRCRSRCTVEALSGGEDRMLRAVGDEGLRPASEGFARPVVRHLDRLRREAGDGPAFRVATRNSFPTGAGLASSASGFAALTLAAGHALGLEWSEADLSSWSRRSGSGSAARSALGGYVQWPAPAEEGEEPDMEGAAGQLAGPDHWDLRDVIALVDPSEKSVSSREGHRRAPTSPHYEKRLELVTGRLEEARSALRHRDLSGLGPLLETEAVELHLVAMSSRPPVYYWAPGTLRVMEAVRRLRSGEGVDAFFTIDAGPNVHVVCGPDDEDVVAGRLRDVPGVQDVLRDRVGPGPRLGDRHLL